MISVIIPAKDASDTIGPCLNGVLAQQDVGVDYEVILVDDGSSDETAAIGITKGVKVIQQECAGPAAQRH